MRQGANSAVRFTTYTTLKQSVQSRTRTGQTLPASVTFAMGAIAGLVTVYTTMPLECAIPCSCCIRMDLQFTCFFSLSRQCDQNAHAVARGTGAVPKFFPLCVSYLYGGGHTALLDWHHSKIGTASGASRPLLSTYPQH